MLERQSPRKVAERLLSIQMDPNNPAIVRDISDGGLGFYALNPVTQSGLIHFSFLNDGQRIEASGELVWTDSSKRTGGLSFRSLPLASRKRIRDWVDHAEPPAGTRAPFEPAPPLSQEPDMAGIGLPHANSNRYDRSADNTWDPPASPGFALLKDNPGYTPYTWDQETFFARPRTMFLRGFVTGAFVAAVLATFLFLKYGNPGGALSTLVGAKNGASPAPQSSPAAPPPVAASPPLGSSASPPRGSAEAPIASAPLPASGDDSKASSPSASAQVAKEPPPADDRSTRAGDSAQPKAAGPGEAELALAQSYLNAKGEPADGAAAVRLLWTAVQKGNVEAEITLADLYARGQGVRKSCGQARVLLRAIERKGGGKEPEGLAQTIRRNCR